MNLHLQPLAQRVDDGSADAVQTARDLVTAAAELAAGVQHGIDDLQRGLAGLLLDVDGDAAAVVADTDAVAGLNHDLDVFAVTGQRLIDGVVHDLIDQVVQTAGAGGADIHAGTFAYGLQTLKDLNLRSVIFFGDFFVDVRHSLALPLSII